MLYRRPLGGIFGLRAPFLSFFSVFGGGYNFIHASLLQTMFRG